MLLGKFIMKIILTILICLVLFGCSSETPLKETNKIFSMDDLSTSGFKVKKSFRTTFPESTDAKWGFYKGRDIAVLRYSTIELAKTLGVIAGQEQTERIEVVVKNIAYGPKVEKTECRGHKANKPNSSSVYSKSFRKKVGLETTLILNKVAIFESKIELPPRKPSWMECVRREPMYTEFIIHGNLVIMIEPLATEDRNDTIKFLENTAKSLP